VKTIAIGLVMLAVAGGSAHAASPFVGHWKLDVAKSHFAGDTMTFVKTSSGFQTSGGSVTYAFAIDGKDYPMFPGRTTAWTKTGDGAWDIVIKGDGKVLTKAHRVLSPDGKRLMTTYVEYRPDGATSTEKDVYDRLSGTDGLAGKWKDVKVDAATDAIDIAVPGPGLFRLEQPSYKQVIVGKTDGSAATLTGPTLPPGAAAKYKAVGLDKWEYTFLLGAKVFGKGVMKVSPDGKMLTDTSWAPGKEDERSMAVYLKQ
jgi:hypothetical protein